MLDDNVDSITRVLDDEEKKVAIVLALTGVENMAIIELPAAWGLRQLAIYI